MHNWNKCRSLFKLYLNIPVSSSFKITFLRYVISTPSRFCDLSMFRTSAFNIASCTWTELSKKQRGAFQSSSILILQKKKKSTCWLCSRFSRSSSSISSWNSKILERCKKSYNNHWPLGSQNLHGELIYAFVIEQVLLPFELVV